MNDNELIAEFMGFFAFESMPISKQRIYKLLDLKGNPVHPYYGPFRSEQMRFDRSWDWLMPVVEKIDRMQFFDVPEYRELAEFGIFSKIENVYDAVIDFIKWYNTNTQKQIDKPGPQA